MHKRYIFSNLIGSFVFNEHFKVISKLLFKDLKEYQNKEKYEKDLKKKFKNIEAPGEKELPRILDNFRDQKYQNELQKRNLTLTKQKIKESVTNDTIIIQAIKNINGLDKVINTLTKELREWFSLNNPEISEATEDHEKLVNLIAKNHKSKSEMGSEFSKRDMEPILSLAKEILNLYSLRKKQEEYLEELTKETCPNISELAGTLTAAKLIELAGSLKHLATMPASTVQLLGAEEALFRHLKTGASCPKYGIIYSHNLIQKTKKSEQGKMAKTLADKIAIAVKVDYFKGKFVANKLKKECEIKYTQLKNA